VYSANAQFATGLEKVGNPPEADFSTWVARRQFYEFAT
jgi:hypothetical protein